MKKNDFGGDWTKEKIEILTKYVPAYLTIMHSYISKEKFNWKLLYYDGFAGSGHIGKQDTEYLGASLRVLDISEPRRFDMYYFVEKNSTFYQSLNEEIEIFKSLNKFKTVYVVNQDFNESAKKLTQFLHEHKNYKTLAFIDPFAMNVKWETMELLKGLNIDLWLLLPTGALNRLLPKNGKIPDTWMNKLTEFTGLDKSEIIAHFYIKTEQKTLFGTDENTTKIDDAIGKAFELYEVRLRRLFKFLSKPYELKNSKNARMFHFFLASQNNTAIRIANDIIKKM